MFHRQSLGASPDPMGQGIAAPASESDIAADESGYTNPNLHGRTYIPDDPTEVNETNIIGIFGKNAYRFTEYYTHDEESTDSEIP